ncbi:hypothetical protein AA0243_2690 [Novacetimonas hansenii NRIC 0243]|nr:hypothetical protein AA0243_2690 [Novacetimonas hansenii NRIC 0243]
MCIKFRVQHDMHRTNTGTGQQRHDAFNHQGQVNCDPVTTLHALILQCIRKAADTFVQFAITYRLRACIGADNHGRPVWTITQVAVNTQGGHIQCPATMIRLRAETMLSGRRGLLREGSPRTGN